MESVIEASRFLVSVQGKAMWYALFTWACLVTVCGAYNSRTENLWGRFYGDHHLCLTGEEGWVMCQISHVCLVEELRFTPRRWDAGAWAHTPSVVRPHTSKWRCRANQFSVNVGSLSNNRQITWKKVLEIFSQLICWDLSRGINFLMCSSPSLHSLDYFRNTFASAMKSSTLCLSRPSE